MIMSKILLLILFFAPLIAFGQGVSYQPLVGIPGVDNPAENFGNYLNQLYFLSISVAALIAVVKIIIAGVKWMMTDLISGKSEAATEIRTSLLGLLLIVSAVLILETINPQLTNFNVLRYATPIRQAPQPTGTPLERALTPEQMTRTQVTPTGTVTSLGSLEDNIRRLAAEDRNFTQQNVDDLLENLREDAAAGLTGQALLDSALRGAAAESLRARLRADQEALSRACPGRPVTQRYAGQGAATTIDVICPPAQ